MSKQAHILALKVSSLPFAMGFGIRTIHDDTLAQLNAADAWMGPRPVLEEDPQFVQVIPYIVVRQGGRILAYLRAVTGGEERLHGKFAIGVGGHIEFPDIVVDETEIIEKGQSTPINRIDLLATVARSTCREIFEEIGMGVATDSIRWTHVIHSQATDVDKVHFGIVAMIDIDEAGIQPLTFEHAIENATFDTIEELAAGRVGGRESVAETWTGLVLDMLVKDATRA